MKLKQIIRMSIIPTLCMIAYIIRGDNFFLLLATLALVFYSINDEMDKLSKRIKNLEKSK